MIISLRGTNGAGKSTIVRKIMELYLSKEPNYRSGRRKPLGYFLKDISMKRLFIPGHYEIANGGIDTITYLNEAYGLIKAQHKNGWAVLYEGKNMTDGYEHLSQFPTTDAVIIHVNHPVDSCVASVRERGHKIQESTIRRLARKVESDAVRFEEQGYPVLRLDREEAFSLCKGLLTNDEGKHLGAGVA